MRSSAACGARRRGSRRPARACRARELGGATGGPGRGKKLHGAAALPLGLSVRRAGQCPRPGQRHDPVPPCPAPLPRRPPAGQRQIRRPRRQSLYLSSSGGAATVSLPPPGSRRTLRCARPSHREPDCHSPQPRSAPQCLSGAVPAAGAASAPPPGSPANPRRHRPPPSPPPDDASEGRCPAPARPAPWSRRRCGTAGGAGSRRGWQSAALLGCAKLPPSAKESRLASPMRGARPCRRGPGALSAAESQARPGSVSEMNMCFCLVPLWGFFASFYFPPHQVDEVCYRVV